MKKLAILSMTFLLALSLVIGQTKTTDKEKTKEIIKEKKTERVALKKLEGTSVNEFTKTKFMKDNPAAKDVEWKRIDTFDKVTYFDKTGKRMAAFYDVNTNLVGTTELVNFTDLPVKGQEKIKKDFKGYTVGDVIFFDDNVINNTDMIMYGVQFDSSDNYFVELSKDNKKVILEVRTDGNVSIFKEL